MCRVGFGLRTQGSAVTVPAYSGDSRPSNSSWRQHACAPHHAHAARKARGSMLDAPLVQPLERGFEIDPRTPTDGNGVLPCPKRRSEGSRGCSAVEEDAVSAPMSGPVEPAARRVGSVGYVEHLVASPRAAHTVDDRGTGLRVPECQALRLRQFGPVAASAASTRAPDSHPHVKRSGAQNGCGWTAQ